MKMDKVADSGNDEFYTPKYAVDAIVPYLKKAGFKSVWCPFDTEESLFVQILRAEGFAVTATHIRDGGDFFDLDIPADVIVSNPPYSLKTEILERAFSLSRPFALLIGIVGIFESQRRFEMFRDNKFEVLYMNRRVAYFQDYSEQTPSKNPPFSSAYFCHRVLPEQACFTEIDKKDSRIN